MSLIEEALRRLQDPLLQGQQSTPPKSVKTQPADTAPAHPWPTTPPLPGSPPPSLPQASNSLIPVAGAVLALTALLSIGGAFWAGRTLGTSRSFLPAKPAQLIRSSQTSEATPPGVKSLPETQSTQPPSLALPWAKDHTPSNPQDQFILSGVVEGLGEPYAVINGVIVGVGEQVDGSTLLEVVNGVVKLRRPDGSETILRVPK